MGFQAGRFVMVVTVLEEGMDEPDEGYVTSWDTWEDAESAFAVGDNGRMPVGFKLIDTETGRVWHPGTKHEWEDAQT